MSAATARRPPDPRRTFLVLVGITFVLLVASVVGATLFFRELELDSRERAAIDAAHHRDRRKIARLVAAVEAYRTAHGALPSSIDELRGESAREYLGVEPFDALFVDDWGRTFRLEPAGGAFRVFTLGRDDALGGEGLDEDVHSP